MQRSGLCTLHTDCVCVSVCESMCEWNVASRQWRPINRTQKTTLQHCKIPFHNLSQSVRTTIKIRREHNCLGACYESTWSTFLYGVFFALWLVVLAVFGVVDSPVAPVCWSNLFGKSTLNNCSASPTENRLPQPGGTSLTGLLNFKNDANNVRS